MNHVHVLIEEENGDYYAYVPFYRIRVKEQTAQLAFQNAKKLVHAEYHLSKKEGRTKPEKLYRVEEIPLTQSDKAICLTEGDRNSDVICGYIPLFQCELIGDSHEEVIALAKEMISTEMKHYEQSGAVLPKKDNTILKELKIELAYNQSAM